MKNMRKIVAIVGPTATGKTGLGVEIATKYNGEIISADSRQVFRGLDIGTGKDLSEYGDVKYHLIDICNPSEEFTMFDWLKKAREVIEDIFSRGKLPVIVGGTGLYIQSLVEGFQLMTDKSQTINFKSQINPKSQIQNYKREQLNSMPLEKLQEIYEKLQAKSCQLLASDFQNPRRLIRAIEKAQEGSKPAKVKPNFEVLQIALDFPREELYSRIDKRVDKWFKEGFYREVEGLIDSGIPVNWFAKIGLEYRILANFIINHPKFKPTLPTTRWQREVNRSADISDFDQMKQEMKWKIHQYARRQLTWFRRFPEIVWVKDKKDAFSKINDFLRG